MSLGAGESGTDTGRMPDKKLDVKKQDEQKYSEKEKQLGAGVQTSQEQSQQPIKPPKQ